MSDEKLDIKERGNILVVDDNEMNRDLLLRRLSKQGHSVTLASDGQEALELLEAGDFDLVLLDIMMPGMNGYEVLERLKSNASLRNIPVVMISALTEMESIVRCIELGAEDYLPKPFKTVLLNARVGACLEKKRLRDKEHRFMLELTDEKQRTEDLLKVILPGPVINELKSTNTVKPRRYDNVAVLFADIVDFTKFCDAQEPEVVVSHLQEQVHAFEKLTGKYGIQKIKTIGDAFMATSGLFTETENSVLQCLQCATEMIESTRALGAGWRVRVGIHVGPVMGGIVGHSQYLFDVWGDTVNTAARVQERGEIDRVCLSAEAWQHVANECEGSERSIDVKGKGTIQVFDIASVNGTTTEVAP